MELKWLVRFLKDFLLAGRNTHSMKTQQRTELLSHDFWNPFCSECRDTDKKAYSGAFEQCRECGGHINKLREQKKAEDEALIVNEALIVDWMNKGVGVGAGKDIRANKHGN